jgi:1-phosphatidylinositol-4-phosphate 5-kinase
MSEVSFGNTDFESRQSNVIPENYKKFYEQNEGGLRSLDGKRIFYIGIIDVFTEYNTAKRCEYVIKSIQHEYGTASCVPPPQYADRFVEFMDKAF